VDSVSSMDIYVLDTETTGLDGSPKDLVLEISIMRANVLKQKISQVYQTIIHYDTELWDEDLQNSWIFSKGILSVEDIQKAEKDLPTVIDEVRQILSGKFVAAYNNEFDFDKFLMQNPWNISEETTKTKIAPCIMLSASEYIRPSGKKYRDRIYNLAYSKKKLIDDDTKSIIINKELEEKISELEAHRASYDAFYSACILLELYKRRHYRVFPQIYYAHSMSIYGKKQEKKELKLIKQAFPGAEIINPAKYERKWKKDSGKEIMKKCLDLLSKCDIVIFSALEYDGGFFVGRGVYIEVKFAEELNKKIYFLREHLDDIFILEMFDENDWISKFGKVKFKE
jgi:DNA polymerase-3 subunit epsilon